MTIRSAKPDDATAIAAIANHYIRTTTVSFSTVEKTTKEVARSITDHLSAGLGFLVLQDGTGITGYASYNQFRKGSGYAQTMEHSVMLAPGQAGVGRGHVLMDALEAQAHAAGIHSLIAGISAENTTAVAFHASRGFDLSVRLPETGYKHGRWIDLVLMQKRLLPTTPSR